MLLQTPDSALALDPLLLKPEQIIGTPHPRIRRRRKSLVRRWRRDLRQALPILAIAVQVALLTLTIVVAERMTSPGYGPTTSISSTSNTSAAPPGITGG